MGCGKLGKCLLGVLAVKASKKKKKDEFQSFVIYFFLLV